MKEKSYSQRRTCALAGIDTRVYRSQPKRPEDRDRMRGCGSCRRLHILLKREGWAVNWNRLYRIYREEGCHCTPINQNLWVHGILGHFCTLNYNIFTGCSLQDLTPLERVQIASARASNA